MIAGRRSALAAVMCALAGLGAEKAPLVNGLPAASADCARIAFVSNRAGGDQVFLIGSDGAHERQLTRSPGDKGDLAWSRDNREVLYSTFADGTGHLWASDLAGKSERPIASVPGRAPTASPDGRRVLYMSGDWSHTRLMAADRDGSHERQITDGSAIAWNGHWSPDGRHIAFTSRTDPKGDLAIYVVDADGGGRRQLSRFPAGAGNVQWPIWSPDGRRLAVQVNARGGGAAQIWVLDAATGEARQLTPPGGPYLDETPSWCGDGRRLAFQSNRSGSTQVWMMNADGSDARQITRR